MFWDTAISQVHLNIASIGNLASFKDKITELPEEVRTAYPGNQEKTIVGHSQLSLFGYKSDGLFQNQAEVLRMRIRLVKVLEEFVTKI